MTATGVDPYLAFVGFYDEWTREQTGDVKFYVRRAKAVPGPVIELGVGTGRIAIPIAQAGQRVIGVDLSAAMLAEARRRAGDAGVSDRIAFAEADMRAFVAEAPVALVIIPFRSFLHMQTTEDQLTCLRNVHRSLAPGGQLILNMFLPDPAFIVAQDRKRNHHGDFTDERGRRCEIWVTPIYDTAEPNRYDPRHGRASRGRPHGRRNRSRAPGPDDPPLRDGAPARAQPGSRLSRFTASSTSGRSTRPVAR